MCRAAFCRRVRSMPILPLLQSLNCTRSVDSSSPRSTIGTISCHVLKSLSTIITSSSTPSLISTESRRSVSLAKRGLDPTQAKRCQVSSSCPSEPLHASSACLDNDLHVFSRGPSYGGTCTSPSSHNLVVHVLAVSRSASPICPRCAYPAALFSSTSRPGKIEK